MTLISERQKELAPYWYLTTGLISASLCSCNNESHKEIQILHSAYLLKKH